MYLRNLTEMNSPITIIIRKTISASTNQVLILLMKDQTNMSVIGSGNYLMFVAGVVGTMCPNPIVRHSIRHPRMGRRWSRLRGEAQDAAVQVRSRVEAGAVVAEEGGVEPKVQPARRGG
jgi:hypothetical protein